ncbi:uncharacterized protein cubi_03158 [Cryptosporidium ubiquitum]|uniref:Protein kinase domain-containing protein n=1 Tax=Cryptosporidium ubiquitum TaxID=857276 RepID=A0A1J4MLI2_9CRYT|nr:uncharacterized protein cubi_03158 [Cryptosporidium ubiquitum]OII75048.1 hypothetical protein cubi_03158 [Cryptosporidium ubiquitum]
MDLVIGRGTFGTVRVFRDSKFGKLCIYKTANSVEKNGDLEKEDNLLRKLKGKQVVERYGSFVDENGLFTIILEYLPRDLRKVILKEEAYSFNIRRKILFEILKGIEHIHNLKVTHNDLKPENVLVNEDFSIKICDFGMATETDSKTIKYDKVFTNLKYKSPERLLGTRNLDDLFASDIWSFGCIAFELLTGKALFNGENEIDQLLSIFRIVGTPVEASLNYLNSLPSISKSGIILPSFKPNWELLGFNCKDSKPFFELLRHSLNPSSLERITATQALKLKIFSDLL